jgi:peptidoglycan hydrolase CwlO-like protein
MTLTIGLSNSIDFASLNEIQSLKQNSFASSLIETISLSLSASKGEDATEVLTMLNNLKDQLKSDQTSDDNVFQSKNSEFDQHIKNLSEEISKLTNEIKDLEARIAVLSNLIAKAKENISSFENRIVSLTQSLASMKEIFESDKKYYEQKIANLKTLKVKLADVVAKLKEMIGSVSGVNKYNHINATETEKRDMEWSAKNVKKSFLQIKKALPQEYANLMELTLTADQGALNKLIEILDNISNDVTKEISSKQQYLVDMENTYNELKEQMENEIKMNKEAKTKQEANKVAYENEKGEKQKEKSGKEARRTALEIEKKINIDLQDQLKSTHEKELQDRNKEIEIVNVLIGIVEKRLVKKN